MNRAVSLLRRHRESSWLLAAAAAGLLLLLALQSNAPRDAFAVAAFVPDYRLEHVLAHADALLPHVTDLIAFSATLTAAGALDLGALEDGDRLRRLRLAAAQHGVARVHLCVGGGGRSQGFARAASSPARRAAFAGAAAEAAASRGLQGVSLDWEGPASPAQAQDYAELLSALRAACDARALQTSVAVHAGQLLPARAWAAAHRVLLMAYDMGARHATRSDARAAAEALLASPGAAAGKLLLGVPAYGRRVRAPAEVRVFAELAAAGGGEGDEHDGFSFTGRASARAKAGWARRRGLGGVFLWELGQDALEAPLVQTMAET